jgi:TRADD-N domain-containing protein
VYESAYQAVVGSQFFADNFHFVASKDKEDSARSLISYDAAFERIAGSTAFVLNQLELNYSLTRDQARGWYRSSLISAGVGFLLIAGGVIMVLAGQVTGGVITSASGLIPNVAAALFFKQSQAANERLDAVQGRLGEAREIQVAIAVAETIQDLGSRDALKESIVKRVLRLQG